MLIRDDVQSQDKLTLDDSLHHNFPIHNKSLYRQKLCHAHPIPYVDKLPLDKTYFVSTTICVNVSNTVIPFVSLVSLLIKQQIRSSSLNLYFNPQGAHIPPIHEVPKLYTLTTRDTRKPRTDKLGVCPALDSATALHVQIITYMQLGDFLDYF